MELCVLFVKICELIRSQCRSNLSRNSLFFYWWCNQRLEQADSFVSKMEMRKGKCDNFFSYGYDKSPLKGVKKPKQSIKRQQPF